MHDNAGQRLSKREGAAGLEPLRQRGLDAAAVVGMLAASLDLVPPGARLSAEELQQQWSLEALRRQLRQAAKT
jgi:glutamyl-tRNA synthetase